MHLHLNSDLFFCFIIYIVKLSDLTKSYCEIKFFKNQTRQLWAKLTEDTPDRQLIIGLWNKLRWISFLSATLQIVSDVHVKFQWNPLNVLEGDILTSYVDRLKMILIYPQTLFVGVEKFHKEKRLTIIYYTYRSQHLYIRKYYQ